MMLKDILGALCLGLLTLCPAHAQETFSFAFLTDIHTNTNPKSKSLEGFQQAIQSAETKNVDFILTGGDNADVDAMKSEQRETAVKLFSAYKTVADRSSLPFHYTIGNHDRYWGDGEESGAYGEKLFESFFGKSYYAFEHKGWLFIVLNSTQVCDGQYCVDPQQQQWLTELLANTPQDRPIIVSTHVPFLSLYYPVLEGRYTSADTFVNQKKIFDLFDSHNLKLVLQGHQHLYEEIKVKDVQFITAGAVCASWWSGAFHGTEEGYLKVNIHDDDFSWEYIDYGWEVSK